MVEITFAILVNIREDFVWSTVANVATKHVSERAFVDSYTTWQLEKAVGFKLCVFYSHNEFDLFPTNVLGQSKLPLGQCSRIEQFLIDLLQVVAGKLLSN